MTRWLVLLIILSVAVQMGAAMGPLLFKPRNFCRKGVETYNIGEYFQDPHNDCRVCICCENGRFRCKKKDCTLTPPPCGADHQQASTEDCCPVCSQNCITTAQNNPSCQNLNCPGSRGSSYQPDNSCCRACGCYWRGKIVPQGPVIDPPTASCEQCTCTNGEVTCLNEALCPTELLKCVNPKVQDITTNCTWICPDGPTCYRGDTTIMPGDYVAVNDKICYCHEDWYPLALCANKDHWGALEQRLNAEMCMKEPIDHMLW